MHRWESKRASNSALWIRVQLYTVVREETAQDKNSEKYMTPHEHETQTEMNDWKLRSRKKREDGESRRRSLRRH